MRSLRRIAAPTLAALAIALLVRTAWSGRRALGDALASPDWPALIGSLACATFAMVWIAVRWASVRRLVGISAPMPRVVAQYFAGEIGKYIPGGIWPVVGRGELAARDGGPGGERPDRPESGLVVAPGATGSPLSGTDPAGAPVNAARSHAYASVLLSLGYLFLAGLVVAGLAAIAPPARRGSSAPLLLLAFIPIGLIGLHPTIAGRAFSTLLRVLRSRATPPPFPAWRVSLLQTLSYAPAWAGIVSATWFAARATGGAPSIGIVALATCLSWVAGFLLLPAPGGLGGREAVFAAVLGTTVASGRAAAIAVLVRLAFVAVDALGALVGAAYLRSSPTRPR